MRTLLALSLIAASSLAFAADNGVPALLAQAQKSAQKATAPQAPRQQPPETCRRDSAYVPAGETWCVKGMVHQCNASSGQWINMGRKCT